MTALTNFVTSGWYEITSEGQITLYFSAIDEGMTSSPADTPANVQFKPRILNPENFQIRRAPQVWVWGPTTVQGAAFGQLELDNYDGAYNGLIDNDVRDSVVTIKILLAASLLTGTAIADAITVATAIIDDVTSDDNAKVTITLKDTIARLDRSLPVRYNPPFVDAGAANVMIPLTFGACRNVAPLLLDSSNRIYQIHDSSIPNLTLAADKAAPLDPHASPPQYVPALNGSGIQLQVLPVGKFTVDCSSYGTQSVIPGADNVLEDTSGNLGAFLGTWSGSPAVPPGWSWTNGAGSSITKIPNIIAGVNGAGLGSQKVWYPPEGKYGEVFSFPSILHGGASYRLNFSVDQIQSAISIDKIMVGGLMVSTALSANAKDYITGYGSPISAVGTYPANQAAQNLSYEFTVPPGSTRDLYFIVTTSTGVFFDLPNGNTTCRLYNITMELLGQYQSLPLAGIPMQDYFYEILVHRAGEDPGIFNSAEAAALTLRADGSLIPMGIHFDAPPNILDALREMLDSRLATLFTDNLGVLRARQFVDPTDPSGVVICDFDLSNADRPMQLKTDKASGLTTLIGARRNVSTFGASDYVTDQAIVPQDVKTRFSRPSQFHRTSSASPAGEYDFAIGATIFDTRLDEGDDAQDLGDTAVGIFSPKVYSDGSFTNGKRRQLTFIGRYDDPRYVGVTVKCNVNDIMFGEIVRFTFPNEDGTPRFVNQLGEVIGWAPVPFSRKLEITVEF